MLKYWKMSSCDQHQTELVGLSLPVWHHCPDEDCCLHLGFNLIFLFAAVVLSQMLPDLIMNLLCRKRRTSVEWTEVEKLNWELNWIKNTAAVYWEPWASSLQETETAKHAAAGNMQSCSTTHLFGLCVPDETEPGQIPCIIKKYDTSIFERWETWYRRMYGFYSRCNGVFHMVNRQEARTRLLLTGHTHLHTFLTYFHLTAV